MIIKNFDPGYLRSFVIGMEKGNFAYQFIYNFLDSFVVYGTHIAGIDGDYGFGVHLDGFYAKRSELTNSGVDVVTTFLPAAKAEEIVLGAGSKIVNAADFNVLYKGTGVNSRIKGAVNTYNFTIKETKLSIKIGGIFLNTVSYFKTAIQYKN